MAIDPHSPIDLIIVPQGAEHRAVMRGLQRSSICPQVLAIPIGGQTAGETVRQWLQKQDLAPTQGVRILLTGLGGGLLPSLEVGDAVVCQSYLNLHGDTDQEQDCALELSDWISQRLQIRKVKALTTPRVISLAKEKQQLGQFYGAEVVDMEGYALLECFNGSSMPTVALSVLRVISDDCYHDIPDLSSAIDPQGKLRWGSLALGLGRQPLPAWHLVRGSLQGLTVLEQLIQMLLHF